MRRGGLLVKFLLILTPLFLVLAVPGIGLLVNYTLHQDHEALAVRFGNHIGRVSAALARHDPMVQPDVAQDLVSSMAVDRALICAELRSAGTGDLLVAQPPRTGCRGRDDGLSLAVPVGATGKYELAIRFSAEEIRNAERLQAVLALSVVAVAFILAVLTSAVGFRLIVGRPLNQLLRAIEQSSATGERSPVPTGRRDELGTVITAFNEMQERDFEREQTLKYANQSLEKAVRARTAELEAQKIEAEAANLSKSQFLAAMSHELRTPLNSIIGFSGIIRQQNFGPLGERYSEFANHIHTAGEHLLKIINDILDLAKIEAGSMELQNEEIDAATIIEDCQRLVRPMAQERSIELSTSVEDDLSLNVDPTKIRQILINLLSNAIKFTTEGGTVTMAVSQESGGGVAFVVADTGIGMRPEDIPVALSPFAQIDGTLARGYNGTGLGLPLARQLTEHHGGSLHIESAPGEGTRVTVRLPPDRVCGDDVATEPGRKSPLTGR